MDVLASGALRSASCPLSLDGGWLLGSEGSSQTLCKVSPGFGEWFTPGEGAPLPAGEVPKGECQTRPVPGSFGVLWRSECVWMAP